MDQQDQQDEGSPESGEIELAEVTPIGFAPRPPIYMNEGVVTRGGRGRIDEQMRAFESKPSAAVCFTKLAAYVKSEAREDRHVEHRSVRMDVGNGWLSLPGGECLPAEVRAFGQLTQRLGYGGAAYLVGKCATPLRAHNVNEQQGYIFDYESRRILGPAPAPEEKPYEPQRVVLRTRKIADAPRSIFAAVSPGYGSFDADLVADAVAEAAPEDAKGGVTYDGRRSRFEVLFQSTAEPKHMAAGETFRAGVVVLTSDDAGSAIRGLSVSWQSLCTNLCLIGSRAEEAFAIRHVGSSFELARKFKAGFAKALGQLERFIGVWDIATEDDLRRTSAGVSDGPLPDDAEEFMRGIFRGLLLSARGLKLPGRKPIEETITDMIACWQADDSSARAVHATSRAALVNAITRYAHTHLDALNPWAQDEVVRQASVLLWGTRGTPGEATASAPKPLPYVEADAKAGA
jgi:hypothetical protein